MTLKSSMVLHAAPPKPYWSAQIGMVRGNDSWGSLDGSLGPQVAVQYTLPLSEKQELRAGVEAFWLNGKSVPTVIYGANWWQALDYGTSRRTLNAQLVSVDYRFHFFGGGTGPYVTTGLLGGRFERSYAFSGATLQIDQRESSMKGGGSLGLGFQFRRAFAVEARIRHLNGANEADHYLLSVSSRF